MVPGSFWSAKGYILLGVFSLSFGGFGIIVIRLQYPVLLGFRLMQEFDSPCNFFFNQLELLFFAYLIVPCCLEPLSCKV